MKETSRNLLG